MASEKELQSGYWVRSVVDLSIDLLRNIFFWATIIAVVPGLWAVGEMADSMEPVELRDPPTVAEEVFGYSLLASPVFLLLAGFTVYRRKNAQFRSLQDRAKPPLAVAVDPLEGSTYRFELITGDMRQDLIEAAEDLAALRRRLRLTKEKEDGDSADERETKQDLIDLYEKKLERARRELSLASDRYHTPDVGLRYCMRIKNPDEYRVAHVEEVVVGFGSLPAMWTLHHEGFMDTQGNEFEFPISLQPNESVLGVYRCELRKAGTVTPKKLADFLAKQDESSFPVQISVHADDTMGDTSRSIIEHYISLGPLEDALKEHWRSSEFYKDA